MIPSAVAAMAAFSSGCSPKPSTKLVEVRPVDQEVVMVCFKDGEVRYRDDGTGPSAYQGHAFADGDDELISYGDGLRTTAAARPSSWTLRSDDDLDFGQEGVHPVQVHRRAKADNVDHAFNYKLDHTVYLVWPHALKQGKRYSLSIGAETGSDTLEVGFVHDIFSNVSEAVHVNIIGYLPTSPIKSADLYHWMGDGERGTTVPLKATR